MCLSSWLNVVDDIFSFAYCSSLLTHKIHTTRNCVSLYFQSWEHGIPWNRQPLLCFVIINISSLHWCLSSIQDILSFVKQNSWTLNIGFHWFVYHFHIGKKVLKNLSMILIGKITAGKIWPHGCMQRIYIFWHHIWSPWWVYKIEFLIFIFI